MAEDLSGEQGAEHGDRGSHGATDDAAQGR
jgi:hypothetical protein